MNCKNCKNFSKIKENKLLGNCSQSINIDSYSEIEDHKDITSVYSASEWGDATQVIVGVDFGCIKFKQK
jgi:hypothetical protein